MSRESRFPSFETPSPRVGGDHGRGDGSDVHPEGTERIRAVVRPWSHPDSALGCPKGPTIPTPVAFVFVVSRTEVLYKRCYTHVPLKHDINFMYFCTL